MTSKSSLGLRIRPVLSLDHGVSPVKAGNMLASIGLMSLAGILIAGPASYRIGNEIPIAITFLIRVLLSALLSLIAFILSVMIKEKRYYI